MGLGAILKFFLVPIQLLLYWIGTWTHFNLEKEKCIVVITGCDSGFGLATAQKLHNLGYIVIAACLTSAGVDNLAGKVSLAVQCDVTKSADIADLLKATSKVVNTKNAKLWAIVNNAGIAPCGFLDWMDLSHFRKVMDVNFFAVVEMIKAFLPLLKQVKDSRIINVSSMAGLTGPVAFGAYCASKHAVEGMSKCVRQELIGWNIHMSSINPGFMKTPLIKSAFEVSKKIFDEAPEEKRSQYNGECFDAICKVIETVQEDPEIVVNEIIRNITVRKPQPVNGIGNQAFLMRWMYYLIPDLVQAWGEEQLMHAKAAIFGPQKEILEKIQNDKGKTD
jgi:NAD(P)-dependent dehydrogenase (short-subunit alcohol dehydrogenase family)